MKERKKHISNAKYYLEEDVISQLAFRHNFTDFKNTKYECAWSNFVEEIYQNIAKPSAAGVAAAFNNQFTASNEKVLKGNITEGIVLLKNNGLLPLSVEKTKSIALIGTHTDNFIDELKLLSDKIEILQINTGTSAESSLLSEIVRLSEQTDVTIFALEQKTDADYSFVNNLLEAVCNTDTKTILLNFDASYSYLATASEICDTILQCWDYSKLTMESTAQMVFGKRCPSGKLPMTFYKNSADTKVYTVKNNDYDISTGEVLYPFGYGLTYSPVEYYRIYLSQAKIKAGEDITVTVFLRNKGILDTHEVVQVYIVDEQTKNGSTHPKLAAFKKVELPVEKEVEISLAINASDMAILQENGSMAVETGSFSLYVGGGQPDDTTNELYGRDCLHIGFLVE